MIMPPTFFLFIGIIVLAFAVIAIVIWVAVLSSRIKRLSDRLVYAAAAQPQQRSAAQVMQAPSGTADANEPTMPAGQMGVTESFMPQPVQAQEPMHAQESFQAQEIGQPLMQPMQPMQQTVRSAQPSMARIRTNAVQPMEEPDDGQAFFDSYRDKSEGQQTGAFGREKPTIPFGEDRNEVIKRENYYGRDVIDTEYDPDSIDFSRVAGYRNIRR